jgi:hypothetical protein
MIVEVQPQREPTSPTLCSPEVQGSLSTRGRSYRYFAIPLTLSPSHSLLYSSKKLLEMCVALLFFSSVYDHHECEGAPFIAWRRSVCLGILGNTTCNRLHVHWMHCQSKVGRGSAGGGVPAPWVRPHPGPAQWPPSCSGGLLVGPGCLPHGASV